MITGKEKTLSKEMSDLLKDPSWNRMKDLVFAYQKLMQEYAELFSENKVGFRLGVVAMVKEVNVATYHDPNHKDFGVGAEVSINPKSKYASFPGYPDGTGTILTMDPENNKGVAYIDFGGGNKKVLPYGHPEAKDKECALMLVTKPTIQDTPQTIVTVVLENMIIDVPKVLEGLQLEVGDIVHINVTNNQIVSKREGLPLGIVANVDEIHDHLVIVSSEGRKITVLKNPKLPEFDRSDRVLLDKSQSVILAILPKSKSIAISSDLKPFEWDDIIGLKEAKDKIMSIIEAIRYPALFKLMRKDPISGILLIGPPGNGKTLLGRAVATLVTKWFGTVSGEIKNFVYIKASEILDMYVGEGPRKVREIFALAEANFKETGIKPIIFIDELDSVGQKRGGSHDGGSGDTITNSFLLEMDGVQESYGIIIGATNRPDILDPAFLRPGRFDHIVNVGSPVSEDIQKHFALHLRKIPLEDGYTTESMATKAAEEYVSPKYALHTVTFRKKDKEEETYEEHFSLKDLGSGAVIMGIVEKAKDKTLKRNIANFEKKYPNLVLNVDEMEKKLAEFLKEETSPFLLEDIVKATEEMFHERRVLNYDDALKLFSETHRKNGEYVKEEAKF